MSYAMNMQMKHIIYECLHQSRSVPISYREKIYFLFFVLSVLLPKLAKMTSTENKHKVHSHRLCTIKA